MPVMAYSPLGGPGASLVRDPTLARIGASHGCSAAAVALAWAIRNGNAVATRVGETPVGNAQTFISAGLASPYRILGPGGC
jgi:diketogulonate reductase-like aldo/keto reductase